MSSPHCLVTWPGCMWPGHQGRTGPELSWLAAESECLGKPIGPPLWVLTCLQETAASLCSPCEGRGGGNSHWLRPELSAEVLPLWAAATQQGWA